jgi:hypothetical protein
MTSTQTSRFAAFFTLVSTSLLAPALLLMATFPNPSFAATTSSAAPMIPASVGVTYTTTTMPSQAQQLSSQLSYLQSELSGPTVPTATFSLSPGQSIEQASSTASNGSLTITLTRFLHTNPDPTVPPIVQQPVIHLAEITLQYEPCVGTSSTVSVSASPSVCVSEASSSYPLMTSRMSAGQSTGYLNYRISLSGLSSTTASFTITDSSYLSQLQNEITALAADVQAYVQK